MRRTLLFLVLGLPALAAEPESLKVNAKAGLMVRSAPSQQGAVLGKLKFGTEVEVKNFTGKPEKIGKVQGTWAQIVYDKKEGFVFAGFLSDSISFDVNHANEQVCVAVDVSRDINGVERGRINYCGPGGMAEDCRNQLLEEAKTAGYNFCAAKMDKKTEKMFCEIMQSSSSTNCNEMSPKDREETLNRFCKR